MALGAVGSSMSNFITLAEFGERHGTTASNVLEFRRRASSVPSYTFITTNKPYLIDETFYLRRRVFADKVRKEAQDNLTALRLSFTKSSIARIFVAMGSNKPVSSHLFFVQHRLFKHKSYGILSYHIGENLWEFWKFSRWLLGIVKRFGFISEKIILQYVADSRGVDVNDLLQKKSGTHEVTCHVCHKTRTIYRKPKTEDALCNKCSRNKNGVKYAFGERKAEEDKVKYYYFCPLCPSVRVLETARRKSSFCGSCSRKVRKLKNKTVQGIIDNQNKIVVKKSAQKKKTKTTPKKRTVTPVGGIDGQNKVIISKPIPKPKRPVLSEEEMMAVWLKKNEVTVIESSANADSYSTGCKIGGVASGF